MVATADDKMHHVATESVLASGSHAASGSGGSTTSGLGTGVAVSGSGSAGAITNSGVTDASGSVSWDTVNSGDAASGSAVNSALGSALNSADGSYGMYSRMSGDGRLATESSVTSKSVGGYDLTTSESRPTSNMGSTEPVIGDDNSKQSTANGSTTGHTSSVDKSSDTSPKSKLET